MSQIAMTTVVAILATRGEAITAPAAFWRHSSMTSGGTIFTQSASPTGTMTRSSSRPSTGMKSGIRSIGLSA